MSLESVLKASESLYTADAEINRILLQHPEDHFAILSVDPLIEESQLSTAIKKSYRRTSLLIHPDKCANPRAEKAFHLLNKAHTAVTDTENAAKTSGLREIYTQISQMASGTSLAPDQLRLKVRKVLEESERVNDIETKYEQRQERQKSQNQQSAEDERQSRKSWQSRWDNDRDARVQLWRSYVNKVQKPKKKKKVLA